jgi:hypothetical protein
MEKRKVGRPSKTKEEKADRITISVSKEVAEKMRLVKQLKKFSPSKFFAKKFKEEF